MRSAEPSYHRSLVIRLSVYLAITLPLIAVAYATAYRGISRATLRELEAVEQRQTLVAAAEIERDLQAVVADLLVMADSTALRRLLETDSPEARQQLGREFHTTLRHKTTYDQIRYLDLAGQEVVRVQRAGDQVELVPAERLQSKSDRYYFRETLELPAGTLFVSPFDLNVEDGKIETPRKPTIRFALPIYDQQAERRGILVINFLGTTLFDSLRTASAESRGQIMLVNKQGYWLYAANANKEWGFHFPRRRGTRFDEQYSAAWSDISSTLEGQTRNPAGLFTFATVRPLEAAVARIEGQVGLAAAADDTVPYEWKVIAYVPSQIVHGIARSSLTNLSQLALALTLLTVAGALVAARHGAAHAIANHALAENERRFREMAETIGQVFWTRNAAAHQLVYVSPAFEHLWGLPIPTAEQLNATWLNAIHPADRPRVSKFFQEPGPTTAFEMEYRVEHSDGTVIWIKDHGFPVMDSQEHITHFVGIAEDVTRLKHAQERLLQSERLAAIGQTMTGLAHESRNALQRSQACLEMLTKRVKDRPDALSLTGRLQAAQNDLYQLYERVREYAAPIRVRCEPIDVAEILQTCQRDLEDRITSRNAQLFVQSATEQTFCEGDAFQLRQVFRNILENALHEDLDARCNRPQIEVTVHFTDVELAGRSALQITISDNGPGSELKTLEDIFQPFVTTRTRGTGLGMAIARRIIEAHQGTIRAYHPATGGLAIEIQLPRSTSHAFA
jgi:PAS domain S-box-containing protein